MIPVLDVYLSDASAGGSSDGDVFVGTCRFMLKRGQVSCSFTYAQSYLELEGAFAVDPHMPLNAVGHHCVGLPGALRDSSPDRWGRHLIARQARLDAMEGYSALRTLDDVDYLMGVHDVARQGALRYALPGSKLMLSAEGEVPPVIELKRLLAASNGIIRESGDSGQIKELLDAGSGSLGGARPKATVLDEGRILLAKFSHPGDEWDVMAWERVALELAEWAGIAVPRSRLVRIGGDAVLLLQRFDRLGGMVDGRRIPYVSGMTLVDAHDDEQRDYVEVAEALAVFADKPSRELRRLFARVAFSVLLHNTDDHLRNLGLLHMDDGWVLSPIFDVNIDPDLSRGRATSIYGESRKGEASALREFAAACGLDSQAASEDVRHVLKAADFLGAAARRNGCPEREIALMEPVVRKRADALRAAFGL